MKLKVNGSETERAVVYTIAGYKGGVAKSTTATNLASELRWMFNLRVLFIDGDPQGDGSRHLWATMPEAIAQQDPTELEKSFSTLLTDFDANYQDVVYTNTYGLDVIPATSKLDEVDNSITSPQVRSLMVPIIDELAKQYDIIIIDTRRSGSKLTLSLLNITDQVIIPMQAEYLALENMRNLIKDIERVKRVNPKLQTFGVLPTMTTRTTASKSVKEELGAEIQQIESKLGLERGLYSNSILPIEIKRSTRHVEASAVRLPIRMYIEAYIQNERVKKEKDLKSAWSNVTGYYQLAEMIALHVPPSLYLPENTEEYHSFIRKQRPEGIEQRRWIS